MGYYTLFNLEVRENGKPITDKQWDEICSFAEAKDMFFTVVFRSGAVDGDAYSDDSFKWYHREEEMVRLSKEFPQFIFTIAGDGEDSDDWWKMDFWNGHTKWRPGEIAYPAFEDVEWD